MTKEDNNKQIFKMLLNKINSLELKQNYFIRSLEIEKKNNKKLNNNTNSEANFQNKTLSNKIENTQHEKQINVNEKLKLYRGHLNPIELLVLHLYYVKLVHMQYFFEN